MVGGARSDGILIQSNQSSATIDRQVNGDRNISLIIMKSCTEMQKVGSGRDSNGRIPHRTIGNITPQVTRQGSFTLFDPITGNSGLSYRSALVNGEATSDSENPEGSSILRISGRKNNFEVEKSGRKHSEI